MYLFILKGLSGIKLTNSVNYRFQEEGQEPDVLLKMEAYVIR